MSALELHATQIAADVLPSEATSDEKSGDWISVITAIISTIQSLLQDCPQSAKAKAEGIRKPTIRQRAALLKQLRENCECCGDLARTRVAAMYRYTLARGAMLTDTEAAAVVEESRDDGNLLI